MKLAWVIRWPGTKGVIRSTPYGIGEARLYEIHKVYEGPDIDLGDLPKKYGTPFVEIEKKLLEKNFKEI